MARYYQGGDRVNWGLAATAFGGALVEFVEAAIIVIAAAGIAGWGAALGGTVLAAAILTAAVAILGTALTHVSAVILEAVVGALLLLFGVKWLTKAILRLGAPLPPKSHGSAADEDASPHVAFITAFNGVLLEGLEVVFIILALGAAGRALGSAIIGAAVACVLIILAAIAARGPLGKVPEVVLKLVVGLMLTSFGTLWLGEAVGVPWWGRDVSAVWLALGNLALALIAIAVLKAQRRAVASGQGAANAQTGGSKV